MTTTATYNRYRVPLVPHRRLPLTEIQAEIQIKKGLRTIERGEPFALPFDRLTEPTVFLNRDLWATDGKRVFRKETRMSSPQWLWVPRMWSLADKLTGNRATHLRNMIAFGHDVHVTSWADLLARHWHAGWANPFTGEVESALDPSVSEVRGRGGFVEDLGWLCGAKVTDAFVSNEIDNLVGSVTNYAAYDFHEVGTSSASEDNNHTALQATSGIARATGTPTDADPIYQNVATITADATETWEEHGIFNASSGGTMMDRSLTGGQAVNSSDQVEYTYQLTKNPEA